MLPLKYRLERKLFKTLFKTGKRISSPYFTLVYGLINYKTSKIAFVVSSAASKKAVIRNRLKRRTRAIILKYLKNFTVPFFVIFIFKKPSLNLSFNELEKEMIGSLKKLGIL